MRSYVDRKSKSFRRVLSNLGWLPAVGYTVQRIRLKTGQVRSPHVLFRSKYALHPLQCRPRTSDFDVFKQIFVHREYRCLDDVQSPGLIIDCGANVGYSSAYFLSRFPGAHVIAIEPDPGNFAALEANLAPYRDRCRTICSAVWSHATGLVISEAPFGDGREWARHVRAVHPGETPSMIAKDIGTVLEESGFDRISILKIDIEGAESVVFGSNYQHWIGKIDNLVIELHGEECHASFMKAISSEDFTMSECDELIVCKRRRQPLGH